ncbi:DcaP family trimeric outer membrane transporter [Eudoraea chungangensis]|uniref:DcaP family trimeric outer membrane transporter n=1 Tax=Eudoraea chungangensis TaxID=1481905 RepID=UPI0023EAFF23|nr:DcaP family trimeric outer membrane transporter [Eudoraea chungangensis]
MIVRISHFWLTTRFLILFIIVAFIGGSENLWSQDSKDKDELPPGWWQLPKLDTRLNLGGYVKLDYIQDFNPIGSPDFFNTATIPTDGSTGSSANLNAKETRLHLDAIRGTGIGDIRLYIEGDFFGTNGAFRLRHAFVDIADKWRAGQWWSNFMDEDIIPATLDFEKPAAYVFIRQPLIRYKHALGSSYIAFSIEKPSKIGQQPEQDGAFFSPIPDITVRYRHNRDWGHLQLSTYYALMQYRYEEGGDVNTSLYGLNLSGIIRILGEDRLGFQGVYGPGIGRYRGGGSTALNEDGTIDALTEFGIFFSYEHYWSKKWTSLLVYNYGDIDNTLGQPEGSPHATGYVAANLIWHFIDNAFVGMEYLRGFREDFDGSRGYANRLQISVKYTFN